MRGNVLPAGGFIIGGGIMGTIMGMFPWSFALAPEVEGVVEGSVPPFREVGVEWELLAWFGEVWLLSIDAGTFGKEFSNRNKWECVIMGIFVKLYKSINTFSKVLFIWTCEQMALTTKYLILLKYFIPINTYLNTLIHKIIILIDIIIRFYVYIFCGPFHAWVDSV